MRPQNFILGLAIVSLSACADSTWQAPEDRTLSARRVSGEVAQEDPALEGSGTLSTAVKAQVVTVGEDGTLTVNGTADVSADGHFAVDAEGMTRTFVVQVLDASGEVVGAATVTADTQADGNIDAGTVGSESTVEAMVWTHVVSAVGFDTVVSSEVKARVDAGVAAAAQTWFDAHDGSDAAFEAMAQAIVGASVARRDQVEASGVHFGAHAQGELRGWLADADDAESLAVAVDAALEADGVAASDRTIVAARAEATFRAALVGALGDAEGGGQALLETSLASSSSVEAWSHAQAWGALASEGDAQGEVYGSLHAELQALAEGSGGEAVDGAALHAAAEAAVEATLSDLLAAGLDADLQVLLGAGAGDDQGDDLGGWSEMLRTQAEASVQAAAESGDGAETASATGEAWVALGAQVDAALDRAGAADDAELRAALMLAAGAFLDVR